MIFRSIHIKEGLAERLVDFTSGVNLIHSEKKQPRKDYTSALYAVLAGIQHS